MNTLLQPRTSRRLPALLLAVSALCLALLLPAATAAAQDGGPDEANRRTVVFELKHLDPAQLTTTLDMLRVRYRMVPRSHSLVVNDSEERIRMAEELIATLDVPPSAAQTIEILVYVLEASRQATAPSDLPEGLESVARNLEGALGFRGFSLVDTLYMRTEDGSHGGVEGGGTGGIEDSQVPVIYTFSFDSATLIERAGAQVIRFKDLSFDTAMARDESNQLYRSGLRTDIEVRAGQTAVVGKATPSGSNQALVLVVRARVVDPSAP
jgi:hypothetical protein